MKGNTDIPQGSPTEAPLNPEPPQFIAGSMSAETENIIEEFGLKKSFENAAQQSGYKSAMDLVLCHFFPEFENACFEYYEEHEGPHTTLAQKFQPTVLEKLDRMLSSAVVRKATQDKEGFKRAVA